MIKERQASGQAGQGGGADRGAAEAESGGRDNAAESGGEYSGNDKNFRKGGRNRRNRRNRRGKGGDIPEYKPVGAGQRPQNNNDDDDDDDEPDHDPRPRGNREMTPEEAKVRAEIEEILDRRRQKRLARPPRIPAEAPRAGARPREGHARSAGRRGRSARTLRQRVRLPPPLPPPVRPASGGHVRHARDGPRAQPARGTLSRRRHAARARGRSSPRSRRSTAWIRSATRRCRSSRNSRRPTRTSASF
ncbi:MAG: hypothetical protein R3F11_16950 [Verrucomicrobiales bacterium]